MTLKKRFLKSDSYLKSREVGKLVSTEYSTTPGGSDPEKGYISKLVSSIVPGEMTDNDAMSVYMYGDGDGGRRLVAASETCLLRYVDVDTLETGDKIDMSSIGGQGSSIQQRGFISHFLRFICSHGTMGAFFASR